MTRLKQEKTKNKYHEWKKTVHYGLHKYLRDNREYYKKFYAYKLNNLHEMDKFLKKTQLPKFTSEKFIYPIGVY